MGWRVGVDIGGTFTDVALIDEGSGALGVLKVPTTPRDFSRGVVEALGAATTGRGVAPSAVTLLAHATTVVTNALLEGKGARAALVTTRGFRDVLELRRSARARLYDLFQEAPAVLVPRHLRLEVAERLDAEGRVEVPLDLGEVDAAVDFLRRHEVEAVAVCLLHAYLDDRHERIIGERLRAALPGVPVFLSSEVLPEVREFERASTTAVCARVAPVLASYLGRLEAKVRDLGFPPLHVMGSGGGVFTVAEGLSMPAMAVESGPAAGVIAAALAGRQLGIPDVISFDMGGTTAKASLVLGGVVRTTAEYEVGGRGHVTRWLHGTGHPIRVPVIDLAEVSAGGGSIAWIDPGGSLRVGPESAGAEPGPVCYGRGGEAPTVTDADLVLGYLRPEALLGGALSVHRERAWQAIETRIARPLGLGVREAAAAIVDVVDASMAGALRIVSIERGHDPRDFSLVAFGGAGPVHAARLAEELGIPRVLVPPVPGAFSALGLVASDLRRDYARTFWRPLASTRAEDLQARYADMEAGARAMLAAAGVPEARWDIGRAADVRYRRQAYELTVPVAPGPVTAETLARLARDFHEAHRTAYGHASPDEPIQIVNLRVAAIGRMDTLDLTRIDGLSPAPAGAPAPAPSGASSSTPAPTARAIPSGQAVPSPSATASVRQVFFRETGLVPCEVRLRDALTPGAALAGPLVLEAADSTVVVPPRWGLRVERGGFLMLEGLPHG